jgi:hypothetical protein
MEHGRIPSWARDKFSEVQLPPINSNQKEYLDENLSFEDYLKVPAISSSGIKRVLESPQHYLCDVMGLNKNDDDGEKDHFRFGRAAHCLVLEPQKFKETYVVEPEFIGLTQDGRPSKTSKDAKEKREQWRNSLSPEVQIVTEKERDDLTYMVDSLVQDPVIKGLLKTGRPEVSGFFQDKDTGLWCRIRADYLSRDAQGRLYLADLKTAQSVNEGIFATAAARFWYDIQLAFYLDGIEQITGEKVEQVGLIAVEKKPPYQACLYWLTEDDLETGRAWYKHGLKVLKKSITENDWPPAAKSGVMLEMPTWRKNQSLPYFEYKNPLT